MKGMFKEGWHPKGKNGGKESWRGDFKGINQVAGWMGKGKEEEEQVHVARPLNTLRDPAEFGPPPKRGVVSSQRPISDRTSSTSSYDRSVQNQPVVVEAESDEGPRPALPSRPSRTASSTNVPPPPPVRRVKSTADPETINHTLPRPEAPPLLPPRLPPRTNSIPSTSPSPPSPAYSAASPSEAYSEGYVNQEAASRLSSAGVSVPALGIGNDGNAYGRDNRQRIDLVQQAPVNELQARFSRMTTKSSSSLSPAPTSNYSSPGTPSNSTRSPPPPPVSRVDTSRSMSSSNGEGLPRKKAPPPPPPKKASIRALPVNAQASSPPPIPHGTKPR